MEVGQKSIDAANTIKIYLYSDESTFLCKFSFCLDDLIHVY